MLSQFFGHGFGKFGAEMPKERMASRMQQAHEAVTDEKQAGEFEDAFENEFLFHEVFGVMRWRATKDEAQRLGSGTGAPAALGAAFGFLPAVAAA
jgi:hypothetical protein